jgi:hypothetical protein
MERNSSIDYEEGRLRRRQDPPYWWPDIQSIMQLFLSVSIVGMMGYVLHSLLTEKISLEQAQRDLLMLVLGILIGNFKDVYAFTFGSSAESKRKGDALARSSEAKDKVIAESVVVTATQAEAALKAATIIAPLAAKVEAPPAAAEAAPAAAEKAVEEALKERTEELNQLGGKKDA